MKTIIALVLLAFMTIGGCGGGGGGDNCDFDILGFANGQNAIVADSVWLCENEMGIVFQLQVFLDGTGINFGSGLPFTWEQTGCRSIVTVTGSLVTDVTNIEGSTALGVLSYEAQDTGEPPITVGCVLLPIE